MADQYVFQIEPTSVHTPDWRDNLERPEAHQVRFHRRFLSASEQAELFRKAGDSKFNEELFISETEQIENLVVDLGDGPQEITDARELLHTGGRGLDTLIVKVKKAYREEDTLDTKNS